MSALFVSATGTDVGKTFITCGLIAHFRAQGSTVDAIKPVASGFDPTALPASDAGALLTALGRPLTLAEATRITPWRFAAPLSPDMAAAREGRSIDFEAVADFCRGAIDAHRGHLFIEGIGGIMVPLDERHTVLDLVSALRVPLLLVAGSYVGTISHTLTALQVLARRNIEIAAIAISESVASVASLADTVDAIARFSDSIDVVGIPRLAEPARGQEAFSRLAQFL